MAGSGKLGPIGLALLAVLLAGCNSGLAALISGLSGGEDAGSAEAVVSDLEVPRAASSPASILFVPTDQEGDSIDVAILFSVGGGAFRAITLDPASNALSGVPSNLGGPYEVLWDFAADLGDESYRDGIRIQLVHSGLSPPILDDVAVGNDSPEITVDLHPPANLDTVGDAEIELTIKDSAADRVKIRVEYNDDSPDYPETSWKRARAAGLPEADGTPEFAFEGLAAPAHGVQVTFVWDSDSVADPSFPQLEGKETDVLVRFSPFDDFEDGVTESTGQFHIDNNEEPFAILDEGSFLLNPDQRRGIAVPFNVLDEESDPVRVVLQWRREGEDFPPLPGTITEILELIDDPARDGDRKLAQVGRQFAQDFTGRVGFMDPPLPLDRVRLPELGGSAAELLAHGIAGETLEILRPGIPAEVSWTENPSSAAVAAVAREDGRSALVLEPGAAGGWRVREIDLSTGGAQAFASGPGAARAMSVDPLRLHVFVASEAQVFRFAYLDGAPEGSIAHAFVDGPRGLAALGEDLVLASGDDSLVSVDFTPGREPLAVLLDGLAQPWGLIADPLRTKGLYLAEHGADRILALDPDSLVPVMVAAEVRPEDVPVLGTRPFPRPRAMALEGGGQRVMVMTEWAGKASLRGLNLRSPFDLNSPPDGSADPFVFEITDQLGEPGAGLATGSDQLRIVCLSDTLALGGGVQQTRSIVVEPTGPGDPEPYDPRTQVVALETGFDPALSGVVNWRIGNRLESTNSSPTGERSLFLWDSGEVLGGGKVQVRILPLDADVGAVGPLTGFKQVRSGLDVPPTVVAAEAEEPYSVAIGDLDGDGDLDLVSANQESDDLTIFFQTLPGQFALDENGPLASSETIGPRSVAVGDLDGDGDLDLVSANGQGDSLTIFSQVSPGQFALLSGGLLQDPSLSSPQSVAIGDLNRDGHLDLVSANIGDVSEFGNVTIFFQDPENPGQFAIDENGPLMGVSNPTSVAIGDLNRDGDLDLVSANIGGESELGNVTIFFQDPENPGRFAIDENGPLADPTIDGPTFVTIGDLDGDGDMDLISANLRSENLTVFFQTSPGRFTFDPNGPLEEPTLDDPVSVALFDLDTDGDLDLVSANLGDDAEFGNVTLFFQTSPGRFTANPSGPLTDPGLERPRSVAVADLDGDGGPDLVSANQESDNLTVFLHASLGQYTVDANGPLGDPSIDTAWDPITGDLNGDGHLDLCCSNALSDNLAIFFQDPEHPGRFTDDPLLLGEFVLEPRDVGTGDLNRDGHLDLVSANRGSNRLTIFFQDPETPGQFIDPEVLSHPDALLPQSVAVGDLDGDGRLDLVSANIGSDNLTVFFQDPESPGEFTIAPELTDGRIDAPWSVAIDDLDGDGDLDLVSANDQSNNLSIFFQTSPGEFTIDPRGPLTDPTIDGPQTVAAADLDGDGDLDLVSANYRSNNLTIFFQVTPGQFAIDPRGPLSSPNTTSPGTLTVGDVDGDGDPDVVCANEFSNTLTIFFGAH